MEKQMLIICDVFEVISIIMHFYTYVSLSPFLVNITLLITIRQGIHLQDFNYGYIREVPKI